MSVGTPAGYQRQFQSGRNPAAGHFMSMHPLPVAGLLALIASLRCLASPPPDAAVILREYRQAVTGCAVLAMDIRVFQGKDLTIPHRHVYYRRKENHYDVRVDILPSNQNNGRGGTSRIWIDDNRAIHCNFPFGKDSSHAPAAHLVLDVERAKRSLLTPHVGPLQGYLSQDFLRIDDYIEGATSVSVSPTLVDREGIPCRHVFAITDYGELSAFFAPSLGHQLLAAELTKKSDSLFGDRRVADHATDEKGVLESVKIELKNVRIEKFGDVFLPTEGRIITTYFYENGDANSIAPFWRAEDVRFEIPNNESLFKVDLSNGIKVYTDQRDGVSYKWQDGEVVPDLPRNVVEHIDQTVTELKEGNSQK